MTVYVYAFEHRPDADRAVENGPDEAAIFGAVGLLHIAVGFVIGRWSALLIPLIPVLIAIPAGDYPGGWPELPVAAGMFYQGLSFGLPLVAIGFAARYTVERRRMRGK